MEGRSIEGTVRVRDRIGGSLAIPIGMPGTNKDVRSVAKESKQVERLKGSQARFQLSEARFDISSDSLVINRLSAPYLLV